MIPRLLAAYRAHRARVAEERHYTARHIRPKRRAIRREFVDSAVMAAAADRAYDRERDLWAMHYATGAL